ncbi:ATP-binding protein [uncultured Roseovarius sp.]|uniref:ATP-binding protein n=1 Tax=uncultured Roseovarius sp. TaxID=293344 RepID=UPI0025965140|nr:ATP-binding protein [uncultured Roseovarius sp.]
MSFLADLDVPLLSPFFSRLMRRRAQLILFGALSLGFLFATGLLTMQVFFKLEEYGSSSVDNIEWTMAQIEVEQVKLSAALERLDAPTPQRINDARSRFDVFYSRINTIQQSQTYSRALNGTDAERQLQDVQDVLQQLIPIFDAGDDEFLARHLRAKNAINGLTPAIRRMSSAGIAIDADRNEAERAALTRKLVQLTVLSLLLLITLLSLAFLLWRLYRLYRTRALENRVTLNRLATILNTSEDAVIVFRPDGEIVDTNDTARTLFGLSQTRGPDTAHPSQSISDILGRQQPDGNVTPVTGQELVDSCGAGPGRVAASMARRADGVWFPIELSANMASRSGDNVCICFLRDISDRLSAEAEVMAARDKALSGERAKATFLARISHEMRTPLHGILGTLDLLEETALSPEQWRYAEVMKSSGQILLNQIDDTLDVTQADDLELAMSPVAFDLDRMLEDLMFSQRSEAQAHNTTLEQVPRKSPLGMAFGDPERVQQILLNLISNAIKFTRDGRITLEASRSDGDQPNIVEFQVSDTGIGISQSDLPRIFDDFVRLPTPGDAPVQGTGLGLGIARNLVTLMGGQIGAESIEGEGSLFWVRLPLPGRSPVIADSSAKIRTRAARPSPPMAVLLVEDNETNRFVLQQMLRLDGHSVTLARDGAEGVALARDRAFDLILMDINMPGLDGIAAARQIRQAGTGAAKARIVALTAHYSKELWPSMRNAGIDDVRTKPLGLDGLRAILGKKSEQADTAAPFISDIYEDMRAAISQKRLDALVQSFVDEGDSIVARIQYGQLIADTDTANFLHRVAGSAAVLGALRVQGLLAHAESSARHGDHETLSKKLESFPDVWASTVEQLRSLSGTSAA